MISVDKKSSFTSCTNGESIYPKQSRRWTIRIDQLYITNEKRFNEYHKQQLIIKKQTFSYNYLKALSKLKQRELVNFNICESPEQDQSMVTNFVIETERMQKSEQKTLAQTTHKIFSKDYIPQIVVEPLKFKKSSNEYRTPKKNSNKKFTYGQRSDKPSSCRTIIMDLQELIEM